LELEEEGEAGETTFFTAPLYCKSIGDLVGLLREIIRFLFI